MPPPTNLKLDISEEELIAALTDSRDPARARLLQKQFEASLKYFETFLRGWGEMNGRVLERAVDRVQIAAQSATLEEQSQLIGKHSVDTWMHAAEEGGRFMHHCMAVWSSMAKQNLGQAQEGMLKASKRQSENQAAAGAGRQRMPPDPTDFSSEPQ